MYFFVCLFARLLIYIFIYFFIYLVFLCCFYLFCWRLLCLAKSSVTSCVCFLKSEYFFAFQQYIDSLFIFISGFHADWLYLQKLPEIHHIICFFSISKQLNSFLKISTTNFNCKSGLQVLERNISAEHIPANRCRMRVKLTIKV